MRREPAGGTDKFNKVVAAQLIKFENPRDRLGSDGRSNVESGGLFGSDSLTNPLPDAVCGVVDLGRSHHPH